MHKIPTTARGTTSAITDGSLYRSSAAFYDRGRLPYPAELPGRLVDLLQLKPDSRLIDVGCGTGAVTLLLAPYFAETVGVDPDTTMLARARAKAGARSDETRTDVKFHALRAEDLPADLGTFTVATFALSFHWTARQRVAQNVFDTLEPGGWFVKISRSHPPEPQYPEYPPRPPMHAVADLVRSYVGDLTQGEPHDDQALLSAAGFEGPLTARVPGGRFLSRSVDDVIAKVYSQADCAPHLFGERLSAFEGDLREMLLQASPTGRFIERQPDCDLFAWQKPGI